MSWTGHKCDVTVLGDLEYLSIYRVMQAYHSMTYHKGGLTRLTVFLFPVQSDRPPLAPYDRYYSPKPNTVTLSVKHFGPPSI